MYNQNNHTFYFLLPVYEGRHKQVPKGTGGQRDKGQGDRFIVPINKKPKTAKPWKMII